MKPWIYHDTKTGTIMIHDYLLMAIGAAIVFALISAGVAILAWVSIQ